MGKERKRRMSAGEMFEQKGEGWKESWSEERNNEGIKMVYSEENESEMREREE